ncbi:MAG: LPS export ABC transporter periplasmic protein LptC, partial [Bacteroidetes bacterium]
MKQLKSEFNKKNIFFIKSIAVIFAAMLFCSCENDMAEVNELTRQDSLPAQSSRNIEIYYSTEAQTKVKITAPLLQQYYSDKGSIDVFPEGIKIMVYNDSGKVASQLIAKYAYNDTRNEYIEVKNNVYVVNKNGDQLQTEYLVWNKKDKKIKTQEFVKITTSEEVIYGEGLEANEDFTQYKI